MSKNHTIEIPEIEIIFEIPISKNKAKLLYADTVKEWLNDLTSMLSQQKGVDRVREHGQITFDFYV